jgi:hypothetical protein
MTKTSPWWRPEFKTAAGWNVAAIMQAQVNWSSQANTPSGNNWKEREAEAKAKLKELELERLSIDNERLRGNILEVDVYASFVRELLGMIRSRVSEIPSRVYRNAPPAAKATIQNPKGTAPLQREIEKLIIDVEEWLKRTPEEDDANH